MLRETGSKEKIGEKVKENCAKKEVKEKNGKRKLLGCEKEKNQKGNGTYRSSDAEE